MFERAGLWFYYRDLCPIHGAEYRTKCEEMERIQKNEIEPCVKCKQAPSVCTCTGGPLYDEGRHVEY